MNKPQILYAPDEKCVQSSRLATFQSFVETRTTLDFGALSPESYAALHEWSVTHMAEFYDALWDFCEIQGDKQGDAVTDADDILNCVFYPQAKISFAENMLARTASHPDELAIISRVAGRDQDEILSWQDLYNRVSQWEQVLKSMGVEDGDRVATYLPHISDAYILMIAVSQRGAIFSSVGTEMGAQATIERFKNIQPKIFIAADGYWHFAREGQPPKKESRLELIQELQNDISSIEHTIVIPNLGEEIDASVFDGNTSISLDVLKDVRPQIIDFTRRDFNNPLAILFSSGSTGAPKCFVHGTGGVMLKHAIEHQLQQNVSAGSRVFFHTTTSWMMFNWLASGLAQGATLMIYDGNPAYPSADAHLKFASDYGCTHLGTAAAIVQDVWARNDVRGDAYDLSALQSLMYTGSVLSEEGFAYVHENIKADISIDGVCGGTDFVGCYAMGNPYTATIAGALKGFVLGMAGDVLDDAGAKAPVGEVGELVVTKPFSSRPLEFWGDDSGAKFRAEYFEHFQSTPPIWRHGDAVKKLESGQLVVEGRSDTTLNQNGVRIGTQQIYDALTEAECAGQITDMLAASFKDAQGGDHTALFLVTDSGHLDDALKAQIKSVISDSVGRLCVPHEILAVPYILKTPNGKKAEKPTAKLLSGAEIKGADTYGADENGIVKTELYVNVGKDLRAKEVYGFSQAS